MTRGNRVCIAVVSALIFTFGNRGKFCVRENAFFPTQALHIAEEETGDEITVVSGGGKIEISFKTVEFIEKLIGMYNKAYI